MQTKKIHQIYFEFAYFSFFLTHLELKRQTRPYIPVVPSKTIPHFRPKWAKCIPVFRPKRRKNPTRWGGTYLYSFYRYHVPWVTPPPPPPRAKPKEKKGKKDKCSEGCEIWLDILTVVVCLCQASKRNLLRLHSIPEEIYRSCKAETDVLSLIID